MLWSHLCRWDELAVACLRGGQAVLAVGRVIPRRARVVAFFAVQLRGPFPRRWVLADEIGNDSGSSFQAQPEPSTYRIAASATRSSIRRRPPP